MKLSPRLAVAMTAVLVATGVAVVIAPSAAQAHGVAMFPASRTFMCYTDGLRANGQIIAFNPACAAAIAQTGTTPLYNWFAVLRSDAGGRTTGFIPDGQICSGGTGGPFDFSAYNAARTDWPLTHLSSGANIQFRYSNWAAHPGTFQLSITRDGWNPATPLAWSDLVPFASVTNPAQSGGPGALNYYFWNAQLPVKSGRHILYIQWVRSDSQENFFSSSDVVFDGGNGEVTGIGPNGTQPPVTPGPTTTPTTQPTVTPTVVPTTTTTRPPVTTPPPGNGACTATFRTVNAWSSGFQGEITVRATTAVSAWTVRWTNPAGQMVTQAWNGVHVATGQNSAVTNATWNGALAANATTTVGFLANGQSTPAVTNLTCT